MPRFSPPARSRRVAEPEGQPAHYSVRAWQEIRHRRNEEAERRGEPSPDGVWRFATVPASVSVAVLANGDVVEFTIDSPDDRPPLDAVHTFIGGHRYEIDDALAAILRRAGYTVDDDEEET